jgi:hypothetical protein
VGAALTVDSRATDEVRIVPAIQGAVPESIKKFEMGRTKRQRKQTEVTRLIPGDEIRPAIRSDCVEVCLDTPNRTFT